MDPDQKILFTFCENPNGTVTIFDHRVNPDGLKMARGFSLSDALRHVESEVNDGR